MGAMRKRPMLNHRAGLTIASRVYPNCASMIGATWLEITGTAPGDDDGDGAQPDGIEIGPLESTDHVDHGGFRLHSARSNW